MDEVELSGAGGTYALHLPAHCRYLLPPPPSPFPPHPTPRVHSATIWIESLVSASPPPSDRPSLVPSQTQAGARAGRPPYTYKWEGRQDRGEGRKDRGEGRLGALHSLLPNPEHHWWLAAGGGALLYSLRRTTVVLELLPAAKKSLLYHFRYFSVVFLLSH